MAVEYGVILSFVYANDMVMHFCGVNINIQIKMTLKFEILCFGVMKLFRNFSFFKVMPFCHISIIHSITTLFFVNFLPLPNILHSHT